jgi:hypothetical protein
MPLQNSLSGVVALEERVEFLRVADGQRDGVGHAEGEGGGAARRPERHHGPPAGPRHVEAVEAGHAVGALVRGLRGRVLAQRGTLPACRASRGLRATWNGEDFKHIA